MNFIIQNLLYNENSCLTKIHCFLIGWGFDLCKMNFLRDTSRGPPPPAVPATQPPRCFFVCSTVEHVPGTAGREGRAGGPGGESGGQDLRRVRQARCF